ncbi:ABC transporter ATP-binding protein [Sediminicola luteus]|uniref:ABC transporter ATP-binding protein n=1 Tax=Sediminicola luteus TaxID=319238 RepID=A0ABV2TR98_9FLAO
MNTIDPHIAISTKDLTIGYQNKKERISIAKDVIFSLQQGELTAIVGINGIGKSTLLRTIGRVQPKLAGEILLDGNELESYDPLALASKISVVLTEPIASKNLTVLELISLGRQPYTNWIGTLTNLDKEKIVKAINMVQIEDLQHKKCYELSDGQLQKVMIARALAQDTNIMLLDEPTSHLDLYHKVHILKLLREIAHETKKTILFTTHEIEIAIQLCDKMLIMEKERSSFGEPCELIANKSFENLFPSDTITFDSQSGSFKVKK